VDDRERGTAVAAVEIWRLSHGGLMLPVAGGCCVHWYFRCSAEVSEIAVDGSRGRVPSHRASVRTELRGTRHHCPALTA
jgi:hypothetical protein